MTVHNAQDCPSKLSTICISFEWLETKITILKSELKLHPWLSCRECPAYWTTTVHRWPNQQLNSPTNLPLKLPSLLSKVLLCSIWNENNDYGKSKGKIKILAKRSALILCDLRQFSSRKQRVAFTAFLIQIIWLINRRYFDIHLILI